MAKRKLSHLQETQKSDQQEDARCQAEDLAVWRGSPLLAEFLCNAINLAT